MPEVKQTDYLARLEKTAALERAGINPFPPEPYLSTHFTTELRAGFESLRGSNVRLGGRLVSKRGHGKIIFGDVEDRSGRLQTVVTPNRVGQTQFDLVKNFFDTGDFVGVSGVLDATNTGEISIWAEEITMLAKALRAAPEAITDPEVMQRQRYLQTLIDPVARERFRTRSAIVQMMRDYFIGRMGCLEVETPIIDSTYGGANAEPFVTFHDALGENMFLRISNELYLKRMTLSYPEGVFEFSRDFRNEGMDRTHNPEFTQVELYKPFWDYNMMMDAAEDMMVGIVQRIHGTTEVPYRIPLGGGKEREVVINFQRPWRKMTVYDGIREKLGIDPFRVSDAYIRTLATEWGIDKHTRGEVILGIFEKLWEDELIQPTFVMDYPTDTSALTKRHRRYPELTERFEMYVGGMETMNCYTELNDPRDQRTRFEFERQKRLAGDQEAMQFDEDFILAQEYGMPPQSGIGISIDRWTMLLTGINHIRQAIYFPLLRRVKSD